MLKNYLSHVAEREALGIPPLPLDAKQTQALTKLLEKPDKEIDQNFLLDLLINRIPPGVDQASYVKATWLSSIAQEESKSPLVSPLKEALDGFINYSQKQVNGTVRIRLFKGNADVIGRESKENSLYISDMSTYGSEDNFNHKSAEGFIYVWGLPSRIWSWINK